MQKIAVSLRKKGLTLRSGAADGADAYFESGAKEAKEIYLPWPKFNDHPSRLCSVSQAALEMAETVHPAWENLSQGAQKLHGRNCYQVLGRDLKTPSDFLVCWTKDGKLRGGTATALTLAKMNNIPIYNLGKTEDWEQIARVIQFLE